MITRCEWSETDPLLIDYHDNEWGVPLHDDRKLFEFIVLDSMQAGLSWLTILRKRDNFKKAFDNFDPRAVALFNEGKVEELLSNKGIIRNQLKIRSTIGNAKSFLAIQHEYGSFDTYIWQFVDGKTKKNAWKNMGEHPAKTKESDAMSQDLKKRGFKFVGSTICYAFMQAAGMVNDHTVDCFRYNEL